MKAFTGLILVALVCLSGCQKQDDKKVNEDDSLKKVLPTQMMPYKK